MFVFVPKPKWPNNEKYLFSLCKQRWVGVLHPFGCRCAGPQKKDINEKERQNEDHRRIKLTFSGNICLTRIFFEGENTSCFLHIARRNAFFDALHTKRPKKGLSLKFCVISKRPINLLGITLEMGENSYVFDFFVRCWIGGKYEWEPRRLGLADRKRLKKWIHRIWTKKSF